MASPIYYDQPQQTEPQISTNRFESEPEIYGESTLLLEKNLDILSVAQNLASEAAYLISTLKTIQPTSIREQFQIELRKVNTHDEHCLKYRMSLRIDPVLWFKYHALNNGDAQSVERLYEIGSCYVDKVKKETEHYPKMENENAIQRIPINNSIANSWCRTDRQGIDCTKQNDSRESCKFGHYNWCPGENYGLTGECDKIQIPTNHDRKYLHLSKINTDKEVAYYQCRFPSTNINRQRVLCRFTIDPNFWIYQNKVIKASGYPYFIVGSRSNAIPVVTLTPVKHCSNEEYVQTSDAWQAVLQTLIYMKTKLKLDKLPLNRIYINFGKWMQQKADDLMYRSCHAHINIVLPRETVEKIYQSHESNDKSINVKKWFPSLVGSILPPQSHRLDDSWELIRYMNDHMIPILFKKNRELKRVISTLKDEIEKLEQENENVRRFILLPTHDGQEADDTPCGICSSEPGAGINNQLYEEEFGPTHDE